MKTDRLHQPIKNTLAFREYLKTCGYEVTVREGCANPWFHQDGLYANITAQKPIEEVMADFTDVRTIDRINDNTKTYSVRLSWKDIDNQEILKNRQKFFTK